jgi:hypothetical protein
MEHYARPVTPEQLQKFRAAYEADPVRRAMTHAFSMTGMNSLAFDPEASRKMLFRFSTDIKTMSATNQKSSGRCWLFAAANLLRAGGVATGLIDFGGNIYAIGAKEDGSAWRVGIRNPENLEDYCAVIAVKDRAVVTSGSYERYFEQDGVRYGHIFDPATGRPAQSGLESVTVIGTDGALCDALSTALFVMGPERACSWLADQRDVEAVLIGERFWVTEGLKDSFAPYGAYAGKVVEWIPQ